MDQNAALEANDELRRDHTRLQIKLDIAKKALEKISSMPEDSLWMDDRDDAADAIVELAEITLKQL